MLKILNFQSLVLSLLILTSCQTPLKSRLAATGGAAGLGYVLGATTAPKNERTELHGMYWAGILGLTAAIASNYIYNDEAKLKASQLENEKLKAQLDLINQANQVLLKEGKGYFKNSSGESLFQNGKAKWRLYQIDQWEKDGPNKMYHKDKVLEIIPTE
jgi:hypothetical protein